MIITKGFGKNPLTKGLGTLVIEEVVEGLREVLRLVSKIDMTLELKSRIKRNV